MIGALFRRCSLTVCVFASCFWLPVFATIVPTHNNLTSTTTTTKKPPSPTPPTTRLALVQDSSETQTDQQHQVAILKQINRVNDDGSYTFGYEAADGSFKIETRDVLGNVKVNARLFLLLYILCTRRFKFLFFNHQKQKSGL